MADNQQEITLATLAKKVEDQDRFNRVIVIVCTLSVMGVMFFSLTEMFTNLPGTIILTYMGNLEKIVKEWDVIQSLEAKKRANAAPKVQ